MKRTRLNDLSMLTFLVSRYEACCTSLAALVGVAPRRHGTTMPPCRALPNTAMNMHYTSFNYGFQDYCFIVWI
jgi:hypothetical protein